MIDLAFARGRHYALLGLARSGLAAAKALTAAGARLSAWDDAPAARSTAISAGIEPVNLNRFDWQGVAALVLSPGIPHSHPHPHPVAAAAKAHRRPIVGDIELLALAETQARYVGITGTNGKSTTTALVGHILATAGRPVAVGGNLGTAVLGFPPLGAGGIYVLELSSYQLELVESLSCDVAILLNITPDHLDRHGGFAGYVTAKKRLFRNQRAPKVAVVGIDDQACRSIAEELAADPARRVWPISVEGPAPGGIYVAEGRLVDDTEGRAEPLIELASLPRLPGKHNWQNVCAAYAAGRGLGLARAEILDALPGFPGLAHRQELLAEIDGVRFVNDSKATNGEAAAKALGCYDTIYWILGGRPKETGLEGLDLYYPHVRHAFLIGEAADRFASELEGKVAYSRSGGLPHAVRSAFALARAEGRRGAVVLLSPAAASFDQYADFEERGEHFRSLVRRIRREAQP